ncbi:hypothetical protein EXIGLDRAFT_726458 [Exidia glandulosa HHB12029]|uniref:Uncharacterized protein n=1 Tax=Exidia glandulosa HHB12029 TaxID=1314781 RepID=A0A165M9X1_EXIGL|nr:hypothetical protein EXIGLDRAFT_726458 [Exidia glandulosa HHB12029]
MHHAHACAKSTITAAGQGSTRTSEGRRVFDRVLRQAGARSVFAPNDAVWNS